MGMQMKKDAVDRFFKNIELIKDGATIDLYESSIDASFERICAALLKKQRGHEIWYDGTSDLTIVRKNAKEIEFKGNMHVMEGQKRHWVEPFHANVASSKVAADCVVSVVCGDYESSGKLYEMFGYEQE